MIQVRSCVNPQAYSNKCLPVGFFLFPLQLNGNISVIIQKLLPSFTSIGVLSDLQSLA